MNHGEIVYSQISPTWLMHAVVPSAVMAALMAAAISCNANFIAFFVAVLISVSSLYRFAVCLSTRKYTM